MKGNYKKRNLCSSCNYCIADCPEKNPKFGDGLGNDNVYKCNTYEKENWSDADAYWKSILGDEYKPLKKED